MQQPESGQLSEINQATARWSRIIKLWTVLVPVVSKKQAPLRPRLDSHLLPVQCKAPINILVVANNIGIASEYVALERA